MFSKLESLRLLTNSLANVMIFAGHALSQIGEIIYVHDDTGLEDLEILVDDETQTR